MPLTPTAYPIDDQQLPWGLTLAEAERQLGQQAWLPPYGGWPNLRGACRSVLGLAAVEYNLRAPAHHKPVMQVSYELAPPLNHLGTGPVAAARWVQPLTQLLGAPAEIKHYPEKPRWDMVTDTARWEWPTVRLSLSVFGGVRQEKAGPTAAGLYLAWLDEQTAARPFMAAVRAQSAALEASVARIQEPLLFTTQGRQTSYYQPDYSTPYPHAALADTERRQAQRALYRDGLCETPTPLQTRLHDQQVALWAVPDQAAWAVSIRQDTIVLTPPTLPAVELITLRPAKGGGAMLLSIGDLHLQDAYTSPTLGQLAAALEQHVGVVVRRVEQYDC
ncbi:hypothetical protein MUN82_06810 [Hymenobacter aerilatus]|uniref:Uncharacterized protein n=1 Tax=Hymenobacter aerilatus TaxID=2932251 RepID=A0A8T9SYP1_9BACT|nr:hypothetical protein [Hymenobacter aerilatus]UOR06807.1 hypothetical protein MUN82_06810 [Hymenobacter aerilatus]